LSFLPITDFVPKCERGQREGSASKKGARRVRKLSLSSNCGSNPRLNSEPPDACNHDNNERDPFEKMRSKSMPDSMYQASLESSTNGSIPDNMAGDASLNGDKRGVSSEYLSDLPLARNQTNGDHMEASPDDTTTANCGDSTRRTKLDSKRGSDSLDERSINSVSEKSNSVSETSNSISENSRNGVKHRQTNHVRGDKTVHAVLPITSSEQTDSVFSSVEDGDVVFERLTATKQRGQPVPLTLLPPLDEPVPDHWVVMDDSFVVVCGTYQSHLGSDLLAAPEARLNDGVIHLIIVKEGIPRNALLNLFMAFENGTHVDSPYVEMVKVLAFRLEPADTTGNIMVDGERLEVGPLQAQILPGLGRVMAIQ
jgi:hypothetical protein